MTAISDRGGIRQPEEERPVSPKREKSPVKEEDKKTGEQRRKIIHRETGAQGRRAPTRGRKIEKSEPEKTIEKEKEEVEAQPENRNPLLEGLKKVKLRPVEERKVKEQAKEERQQTVAPLGRDPLATLKAKKAAQQKPSSGKAQDAPDIQPRRKERIRPDQPLETRRDHKEYLDLFKEEEQSSTAEEREAFNKSLPIMKKTDNIHHTFARRSHPDAEEQANIMRAKEKKETKKPETTEKNPPA